MAERIQAPNSGVSRKISPLKNTASGLLKKKIQSLVAAALTLSAASVNADTQISHTSDTAKTVIENTSKEAEATSASDKKFSMLNDLKESPKYIGVATQLSPLLTDEQLAENTKLTQDQIAQLTESEFRTYLDTLSYDDVKILNEEMMQKLTRMEEDKAPEKEIFAFEDLYFVLDEKSDELHVEFNAKQDAIIAQLDMENAQRKEDIAQQKQRIEELRADTQALQLITLAAQSLQK